MRGGKEGHGIRDLERPPRAAKRQLPGTLIDVGQTLCAIEELGLLTHAGVDDDSGTDRVHADAVWAEFLGQALREIQDACLADAVRGMVRDALLPRPRCDVDDATALPGDHRRQDGTAEQERSAEIDVQAMAPELRGEVEETAGSEDACVVHEHVDARELAEESIDGDIDVRDLRHVADERHGPPSERTRIGGRVGERFGVAVEQREVVAVCREAQRDGATDAGAGTGHDGNSRSL